jgi:hypothetical protein
MKPADDRKSELATAIEAANASRPCNVYPVAGLFGLGGKAIHKIAIRVNLKSEEDRALVQAHRYAIKLAGDVEAVRTSDGLLLDAMARHALFEACREVTTKQTPLGEEDTIEKWPAFPSGGWMAENFTTDQIAGLLNLYNQTRAEMSGWFDAFDLPTVDSFLGLAADAAGIPPETQGNPLAKVMLAQLPREQIQLLLETAAMRLKAAEAEIDRLKRLVPAPEEPAQ